MPVFRQSLLFGRSIKKALLSLEGVVRGAWPGTGQRVFEQRKIEKEICRLSDELRVVKWQKGSGG